MSSSMRRRPFEFRALSLCEIYVAQCGDRSTGDAGHARKPFAFDASQKHSISQKACINIRHLFLHLASLARG
eukprot:5299890-Pyramimonas_sp.AAC.1